MLFLITSMKPGRSNPSATPCSAAQKPGWPRIPIAPGGPRAFRLIQLLHRAFQRLAGELVSPKTLVCPADTGSPALLFAALQSTNLTGTTFNRSVARSAAAGLAGMWWLMVALLVGLVLALVFIAWNRARNLEDRGQTVYVSLSEQEGQAQSDED